jgi:methyl-accepting chemotaxis protein
MINSIKFQLTFGVGLLLIAIMASIPLISSKVEISTTSAFNTQSEKEQLSLLSSLSETQKEGLIAWMRPWYSDKLIFNLLPSSFDEKKWEASLLGIGNQISVKYGVERIMTFDEDLKLINDYKAEPKSKKVDTNTESFQSLLKLAEEDDAISRGIIQDAQGIPSIVIISPIEHEASEVAFYQAFVINLKPLLKTYQKSTTYSSLFQVKGQNITLKTDKKITGLLNTVEVDGLVNFEQGNYLKRTINLPGSLLGEGVDLVVFVLVTDLIKEFSNTKKTVMNILLAIFVISVGSLVALVFFLLNPLNLILNISRKVSTGDYSIRSDIKSKSEIGVLSNSFNDMLSQIERKDLNMSSLLDGLTVGVFDFNKDGAISKERSQETNNLFSGMDSINTLGSFFSRYDDTVETDDALGLLFDPDSLIDFNSLVEGIFPLRLYLERDEGETTHIKLDYSPIYKDKLLIKVIVIAEDITKQVTAERSSLYQIERVKRITAASSNIDSYMEEISVIISLFEMTIPRLQERWPVL